MAEEVKVTHDLETGFYERGDGLLTEHLKTQDENLHSLIERYGCKRMIIVSLTDPIDSDEDTPEDQTGNVLFEFSERVEPDSNDDSVNGCDIYNAKIYAYKENNGSVGFWLSVGLGISRIINIIKNSENNEETLIVFNSSDLSSTLGKEKKIKILSTDTISTLFSIIANQVEMLYHEEKEEKKLRIIVTIESDGSIEYVDSIKTMLLGKHNSQWLDEIKKEKKNKKKNKKKDKKKKDKKKNKK